jgi:hypothetical protein
MPSFRLRINELNLKIAERLEASEHFVKIKKDGEIHVEFQYGLTISRIALGDVSKDLTEKDWRNLANEIKNTLVGAKIREYSDQIIGIQPLRTEWIHVRVNPVEKALILDAAKLQKRRVADFARIALLKAADEVFNAEVMKERQQSRNEQKPYVA